MSSGKCWPFCLGLNVLSKDIITKGWDAIAHQCLYFNGFEVRVWMSNYVPHKNMDVVTYARPNLSETMLAKAARVNHPIQMHGIRDIRCVAIPMLGFDNFCLNKRTDI